METDSAIDATMPLNDNAWHQVEVEQVIQQLDTDLAAGLSSNEASKRLARYGPNRLVENQRRSWPNILLAQLKSSLVFLLIVAALISLVLGESTDAMAILAIIVLNTLLGFWQDFKAEKALAELKKLAVNQVTVRRDGITTNLPTMELVPGDIVLLQAGFFVPADCRVIEQHELAIDESALTGESLHVSKSVAAIAEDDLPVGDRTNSAFMGTLVVRGKGVAAVAGTGMQTELGKIAGSLESVEPEPTPLQVKLGQFSRLLAIIAIVVVGIVFVAGLIGGQPPKLMLLTALSMAVALVPEGLPAVATVTLAIGARQMFKRNALIRQLPAVETLGSVSVICSDKTGTLTQNKMTATVLDVANQRFDSEDLEHRPLSPLPDAMQRMIVAACLCNDAHLKNYESGEITVVGEPTEQALVEIAARLGINQWELQRQFPRLGEVPFDSDRKRMTTLHEIIDDTLDDASGSVGNLRKVLRAQSRYIAFTKGAVDALLEFSSSVWVDGKSVPLDDSLSQRIRQSRDELAAQGTRVLAVGFRSVDSSELKFDLEQSMTFIGMIGLTDPPRAEAMTAVALCRRAGIRPIMITGDHPLTAISVARQIGISTNGQVITGKQLSEMDVDTLRRQVNDVNIFARVAPSDKLHIVEALQHNHEVVAMTGDGVNDAPALKQASVGVAMGITGTDVSKQAANVVLMDDNFATIVAAVEQGRIVYDNIRKFVKYTMSSNVGELLVMTIGVVLGLELPLLPLQILWINLVTDGLPGLALAIEPAEKNTMDRLPLPLDQPICDKRMKWDLFWIGGWICLASLVTGQIFWSESKGDDHWRTLIFTVLTLAQMANVFACRSERPFWTTKLWFKNKWLWAAVALTFALQLVVIYWHPIQQVFRTQDLTMIEFCGCIFASVIVFFMIEFGKVLRAN